MSYNGSGTFTINTTGQPVVAGTVISSSAFNSLTNDLATGLTTAITKDGQTTTTARITFAQGVTSSLVTDSSSVSTGSIITGGGVGVAKKLYVGSTANIAGKLTVTGFVLQSGQNYSAQFSDGVYSTYSITHSSGLTNLITDAAMAFYTSNTERMRISSSGDVLVGTTTAIGKFGVLTPTSGYSLAMQGRSTDGQSILSSMDRSGTVYTGNLGFLEDGSIVFGRLNTGSQVEACRTDSSGNLLVGTTSASGVGLTLGNQAANSGVPYAVFKKSLSGTVLVQYFYHNATGVGSIQCSDTATSYVTLSDYRLKKDIAPMTGALAKVLQLKPVTYKWKSNGSDGEGFIAHELAEICPHAVAGEKDAVDADKNIVSQGIDTSFLVATLTAAIQELKAINDSLTLRIVALESK